MRLINDDLLKSTKTNVMKKLLIFLTATFLFASCNNNGGTGMGGGWNNADRSKFMDACVQGGQDKQICSCVLGKLEKKFSSYNELDQKGTAELGKQLATECLNNENGNRSNNEDNNTKKNNNNEDDNFGNNDDNGNNNNDGGGWTNQQRKQYIKECSGAAVQQGTSQEQADSYCECMTSKVEKQYSFREANQLTAADFQTPKWQNAAANCRGQY